MNKCAAKDCEIMLMNTKYCNKHYSKNTDSASKHRQMRGGWIGKICDIEGCEKVVKARGMCSYHYQIDFNERTEAIGE